MKPEGKGGAQKKETFSKSDFRAVKIKNYEEVPKSDKLLKFTLNDGTGEDRPKKYDLKEQKSLESYPDYPIFTSFTHQVITSKVKTSLKNPI